MKDTLSQENMEAYALWERFHGNLSLKIPSDWPKEWGHPFAFKWLDDVQRDKVVNWLCQNDEGQTDLPVAQVLRWLLWIFRAAQYRRNTILGEWFDRHRWRWAINAEAMQATGLSEKQLRRAVGILERRRLIVVVRDYKINNVPHYRPSPDLFRLCVLLCRYSDSTYLTGFVELSAGTHYVTPTEISADDDYLRSGASRLFKQHYDEARKLVVDFAKNPDLDRFAQLTVAWHPLETRALAGE